MAISNVSAFLVYNKFPITIHFQRISSVFYLILFYRIVWRNRYSLMYGIRQLAASVCNILFVYTSTWKGQRPSSMWSLLSTKCSFAFFFFVLGCFIHSRQFAVNRRFEVPRHRSIVARSPRAGWTQFWRNGYRNLVLQIGSHLWSCKVDCYRHDCLQIDDLGNEIFLWSLVIYSYFGDNTVGRRESC